MTPYDGDADPRKLKAAEFFAGQAEAAHKSMAVPSLGGQLEDMVKKAKSIAKSVRRRKSCTDKQLAALENIVHGIRKWIHQGDA